MDYPYSVRFGKKFNSLLLALNYSTRIVLFDNGSLRPEATFSLRRIAAKLSRRLGERVYPVSLAHSGAIAAEELHGVLAREWPSFLECEVAAGARRFLALPLFFGPSAAITRYLPEASSRVLRGRDDVELRVGAALVDLMGRDAGMARILEGLVLEKLDAMKFGAKPVVVVVDHGSPVQRVVEARDLVARQLEQALEGRVARVVACSMERREGAEYDFNDPLLEVALEQLWGEGVENALLCPLFFSPGRHAGVGGDIERIVDGSAWGRAGKELAFCGLVGEGEGLIDLLALRYGEISQAP